MSRPGSTDGVPYGPLTRYETLRRNQQLHEDLPHLKHVFGSSTQRRSEASIYDFDDFEDCLYTQHSVLDFRQEDGPRNVASIVLTCSPGASTRIVVIEDICSDLVVQLIDLLDIDVEMFEEHLLNCGWPTDAQESDPDPTTWASKRVKRSHFSLQWSRPYKTSLSSRSMTIVDRKLTVREPPDLDIDDWTEDPSEPKEYTLRYKVNTWRPHLNFDINNLEWSEKHRTSTNLKESTVLASDERLTIWRGTYNAHNLIIVLTDTGFGGSLSTLRQQAPPDQFLWARNRNSNAQLIRRKQPSHVTSNAEQTANVSRNTRSVDRHRPPLPTEGHGAVLLPRSRDSNNDDAEAASIYLSTATLPLASESASLVSAQQGDGVAEVSVRSHPGVTSPQDPAVENNLILDFLPQPRPRMTIFIRNIASRCPIQYMQLEEARSKNYLAPLTTTREDFGTWIEHTAANMTRSGLEVGVVSVLFDIFCHDTHDFLQIVEHYLDEMISASDDEVEVEKSITLWRKMLSHLDWRLRQITKDATAFAQFLSTERPDLEQRDHHPNAPVLKTSERLTTATERVQQHLRYTNTVITSSILVAESRRGINEAESVTRLTELAFIYVPLSFAASFFGMQVKELNPSTTSITGFVGLALGVVAVSYATRLVIRSKTVISLRQRMMASVRQDCDVPDGQHVRTRDFLNWVWHRSIADHMIMGSGGDYHTSLTMFLVILSGMVVMISVWSSTALIPDMKIAISMAAIVIFVCFIIIACASSSQLFSKMARERRLLREKLKRRRAMRNQQPRV